MICTLLGLSFLNDSFWIIRRFCSSVKMNFYLLCRQIMMHNFHNFKFPLTKNIRNRLVLISRVINYYYTKYFWRK